MKMYLWCEMRWAVKRATSSEEDTVSIWRRIYVYYGRAICPFSCSKYALISVSGYNGTMHLWILFCFLILEASWVKSGVKLLEVTRRIICMALSEYAFWSILSNGGFVQGFHLVLFRTMCLSPCGERIVIMYLSSAMDLIKLQELVWIMQKIRSPWMNLWIIVCLVMLLYYFWNISHASWNTEHLSSKFRRKIVSLLCERDYEGNQVFVVWTGCSQNDHHGSF